MRTYKIEELALPTKYGEITAKFQIVLHRQVYVLVENWYRLVRGVVLIWNARLKMYQIYPGLFEAIRGTKHAKKGYGLEDGQLDESGEIHQLTLSRTSLAILLRHIWDYGNLSQKQQLDYADGCLGLFEEHRMVKDEHKVVARDRIQRAASIFDKLGRRNPSSRAPMLWSSADKLEQRQINIRDIARWVDIRQFVLLTMLDEMYEIVHRVYEEASELAQKTAPDAGFQFDSFDICESITTQTESLIAILQSRVDVLPFRRGFINTATDLDSGCKILVFDQKSVREKRNVHRLFDRAQRAMALYMIRRDLEPIIWCLTSELAKRKANRQADVLDKVLQDLVKFCEYLYSIQNFDQMFRRPVLPRMHHHLSAVVLAGRNDDWPAAKQELQSATVMF